jgi:hypothetical protein
LLSPTSPYHDIRWEATSVVPLPLRTLISLLHPQIPRTSHLSCPQIDMENARKQHSTIFQGLRPPPCSQCISRCQHYLCPNCAIYLSPCKSPIGGLGNPNAMCCNCWCAEVRRCVMSCNFSDSSSDDNVSDYEVIFCKATLTFLLHNPHATLLLLVCCIGINFFTLSFLFSVTEIVDA